MILADQMRYREALELFDRALEVQPRFGHRPQSQGAAARSPRRARQRPLELLHEALSLAPDDDYAHYNIGLHHLKYGEYAAGLGRLRAPAQLRQLRRPLPPLRAA